MHPDLSRRSFVALGKAGDASVKPQYFNFMVLFFKKKYPPIIISTENGFVDLSLTVDNYKLNSDKSQEIVAKGALDKRILAFKIIFSSEWDKQKIEDVDGYFYWGKAHFISLGEETDSFLEILTSLYNVDSENYNVPKEIYTQVVGLNCNPEKMDSESNKMKFFFNPDGDEELYSEVFINIDINSKTLEFNEKDNDYRLPLVNSLTQKV